MGRMMKDVEKEMKKDMIVIPNDVDEGHLPNLSLFGSKPIDGGIQKIYYLERK